MKIDKDEATRVAIGLLDEQGLDKLTVRKLATELGVQAPALYWHFDSKRALLDQMTDAMLAPATAGLEQSAPWQRWLEESFQALRRALLAHRDGGRVASGANPTRAIALGTFIERTTAVLNGVGFSLADASRAAGALVHFVIGRAVEEQSRPTADIEMETVNGEDFPFPTLAQALRERHATANTPDDDFAYTLSIMLAGLRTLHETQGTFD
jgi:TetR/AcrR family tetracycline transcriptional repressor